MQLMFMGLAQAQLTSNPVLIDFDDTQITRRQFEHEFETAMVMKALETGVPIKNQDQISVMEHRFLEQRAKELVLLKLAGQRGIQVSEQRLDEILNEYMQFLGYSGYSEKNLHRLGFFDAAEFRNNLRDKHIILLFLSEVKKDLGQGENQQAVIDKIEEYYNDSGVRIYPENIDIPYLK